MQYCIHSGVLPLSQRCPSSTCRIKVWLYLAWSNFSLTICTSSFPFISDHLPLSSRIDQFRGEKKTRTVSGIPQSPNLSILPQGQEREPYRVRAPACCADWACSLRHLQLTDLQRGHWVLTEVLGLEKAGSYPGTRTTAQKLEELNTLGTQKCVKSYIFKTAFLKMPSQRVC